MRIVRCRGSRSSNDVAEDFVEMSGKLMAAGIDVDGWGQGLDVDGFLDPPPNPVLLRSKGGDILFPEVVLVVAGML